MSHTITDTIEGKTITNEEFYKQAVRWASVVRNVAKRNTLQFTKGKRHTSITKKSGKVERRLRDSIQKNMICLVSVSVLTQKSATCYCKLLILTDLKGFVLHEGFEPSILRLRI